MVGTAPARLFVAVWPPPAATERIAALPRPALAGLRWTGPEQWHVTLHFLGPVALDDDALARWEGLFADEPAPGPPPAVMGPAVGRFANRVLHVPVAGLDGLAATATAAMAGLVAPTPGPARPFRGHVTLARADARRARIDLRPLTGTPLSASWDVDEVTLVRSHLGPPAARYEVVARHRL